MSDVLDSLFYMCEFLLYILFEYVRGSLRIKNFIASNCFTVIVEHMTIKVELELDLQLGYCSNSLNAFCL